jgi:hypothetical protein
MGHGKRGLKGIARSTLFPENAPWQHKQRKNDQKNFFMVSPFLLYKINKKTALLKGK